MFTNRLPALVLILSLAGCDQLTRVTSTSVILPQNIDNAGGAVQQRNSAAALFAQSYSAQAFYSGLLADEFTDPTGSTQADRRIVAAASQVAGQTFPWDQLSGARLEILRAIAALKQYAPTPASQIGELYAFLGYTETFFVEDMCSGVPIGVVVNGTNASGPALSRSQLLALALAHFDTADGSATGDDSLTNLVAVGRARALLDSNDLSDAATAARSVPLTFAYTLGYSASLAPQNQIALEINILGLGSVSDHEGENGLDFVSAQDPRLVTAALSPTVTGVAAISGYGSPMTLANGVEAALAVAEMQLRSGNAGWAAVLNGLRQIAIVPAMDTLPSDSTLDAPVALQQDALFRERAFWLFATGHRQGDLRRLVRQYARGVNTVFPTGPYRGGPAQYGTDVTYVPFGEQFNASYHGCIDRLP